MNDKDPLVSIITPVYNHEKYIVDYLKGVIAQTYPKIEIIMIDDCSTDDSYRIIEEWLPALQEQFGRVIAIRHPVNKGLIKTLNELLDYCQGKYVKAFASDDFLLPEAIAEMVCYYEENPDLGLIYSNGIYGDETAHFPVFQTENFGTILKQQMFSQGDVFEALYYEDFIPAPGVMIKKETYDKLGKYDESIGIEDWEYYLRIACGMKIGYLDKKLYLYRIVSDSISHDISLKARKRMVLSQLAVLQKYREAASDYGRSAFYYHGNAALAEAFYTCDKEFIRAVLDCFRINSITKTKVNAIKCILYKIHMWNLVIKVYDFIKANRE